MIYIAAHIWRKYVVAHDVLMHTSDKRLCIYMAKS